MNSLASLNPSASRAAQAAQSPSPRSNAADAQSVLANRLADKLADGQEIEWPVPYWFVDAGAALMLLLLAALDEGLGAGVSGVPLESAAALRDAFGIPDDVSVVALVTVGRSAPDPGWSAVTSRRTQPRRAPDEVVRWERWEGKPS